MAEEKKNKVDFPDEITPRGNAEPLLRPAPLEEPFPDIPMICSNPKGSRYDATPPPPPPVKQFPEGDGKDPYRAQIEPTPKLPPPPHHDIVISNPKGSRYDNGLYPPRRNWPLRIFIAFSVVALLSLLYFFLR